MRLVELPYAWNPQIQRDHAVQLFVRYRDAILIVYHNFERALTFINHIRSLIGHIWKLECSEVSSRSVSFLDIEVHRAQVSDTFVSWRPFTKVTHTAVPLNASSCHHPCSLRWPLAHLGRLAALSCDHACFKRAKFHMILRLVAGRSDPCVIAAVMGADRITRRIHLRNFRSPGERPQNMFITLSIPFHQIWFEERLDNSIALAMAPFSNLLFNTFGLRVEFRIAW